MYLIVTGNQIMDSRKDHHLFFIPQETTTNTDAISFENTYERNLNWMDEPNINVKDLLMNRFRQYYTNGEPNYKLIQHGILKNDPKAKDLFKSLFKMPYKLKASLSHVTVIKNIEQYHGDKILAHGVEEAKGGMYNLLMILICDSVRVSKSYWGNFRYGMPNISPLSHGPYYIIGTTDTTKPGFNQNKPTLEEIECILVPFKENIEVLQLNSTLLHKLGMISEEQHKLFCSKLVDYDNFLAILNQRKLLELVGPEQLEELESCAENILRNKFSM